MTGPGWRPWTVALLAAVALHLGVAVAVLWQAPSQGTVSAGIGGIEVALGTAGGAPGEASPVAASDTVETVTPEQPTAESVPEAVPETVPEQLPEAVEPVREAAPVEPRPVVPEVAPVEVKQAETVSATPVLPPPPRKPSPPPRARPVEVTEAPSAAAPAPVAPAADLPPPEQVVAAAPAAAGSAGKAGTQDRAEAGSSASNATAGGMAGQQASYGALLNAWLNRYKEYPSRAQRRRQEGRVMLHFVIDAAGRVHDLRIHEGSGYPLLDEEALALVRRAEPLPQPTPDFVDKAVIVPVDFYIR